MTLLEVLAAFLIFSLVFTVLIGTSQNGVQGQGRALRQLEASDLADQILADIEIPMARRELPVIDEEESQRDLFTVRVRRSASLGGAAPTDALSSDGEPDPEGAAAVPTSPGSAAGLLAAEMPEVAKHVARYDVEVEWMEPDGPAKISRTTFAFDWPAARAEYAALFQRGQDGLAGGSEGGADGEDGEGSDGSGSGDGSGRSGSGSGDGADASPGDCDPVVPGVELTVQQMQCILEQMQR